MRETRADTTQAIFYAIGLHVLLFALAFMGLWWTRSSAPASAGGGMEAELIDPSALPAQMRRALADRPEPLPEPVQEVAAPQPQPLPEPLPEDAPVQQQQQAQEPVPEPDPIDQQRVERDAISAETAEREQEEKRRQEQIDLTERERQEEAEKKQRLAAQQLQEIRVQRAAANREAQLAEEKLKQLADRRARNASEEAAIADASASAPPGDAGANADLAGRYAAALSETIRRNWTRPENLPLGQRCRMTIRQLPGGEVIDVQVAPSCPYDDLGKRSIEAAVRKAEPLPYDGFEEVFNRTVILNFDPQDR
ncbi:MAG: cell envelope integrity protein TolA [Pseudomonadota bacterium]|nr:cell envelope integrity protein TolA [Pseudomonadota bacterium]